MRVTVFAQSRLARAVVVSIVGIACLLVLSSRPATAGYCEAGIANDFDGDGAADIAIADPQARIDGFERAGRVHVVYASGLSQTFSQADPWITGGPETNDQFGYALATTDWNKDGCSDLVVSSPFEAVGTDPEVGGVDVLFGSPSGFGVNTFEHFAPTSTGFTGSNRADDRFGYSVAAGKTGGGDPYLIFGSPGREVNGLQNAGGIAYARGPHRLVTTQESTGALGNAEAGDLYGYSVAASGLHLSIGAPGEALDVSGYAGSVGVFTHTVTRGELVAAGGLDQEQPGNSGTAEPGDLFGRSLAMTDYLPAAGGAAQSLLVIGSPGEAIGTDPNQQAPEVGRVVTISANGTLTELASIHRDTENVDGFTHSSQYFGWSVAAVNRNPGQKATWPDLLFAAGAPGADTVRADDPHSSDSVHDHGSAQVFSAVGAPGDHDVIVGQSQLATSGWSQQSDQRFGQVVRATATHLYIGDPWADSPAVYGIPWNNLTSGAAETVLKFEPGAAGLPADGVVAFGAAIA